MTTAEKIKEIRTNLKLSQKEFAGKIEKSVATLKNYESGKTNPGEDVLTKISEFADVSKEWLAGKADEAADAMTVTEIEVKKNVRKGGRKAKEKAEEILEKVEDAAEAITATEIEVKKAVRKGGRKAKEKAAEVLEKAEEIAEPVKEAVEPAVEKVGEAVEPATKAVKETAKKAAKKVKKPAKKAAPVFTIEASMGGQITVDEIMSKIPADAEQVYIKTEENKAFWVKGDESGDVDLW